MSYFSKNLVMFKKRLWGWQMYALNQRCPRVFFRSPQMWRMSVAIRHILRIELFYTVVKSSEKL
jgi:hypothetical protein